MPKDSGEDRKRRLRIQRRFWSQVGGAEHINLPKLEDAVRKEFGTADSRVVEAQVQLMQNEGRVRVQEKAKVWVKTPEQERQEST